MAKRVGLIRFSLRFALALITVACCAIGWWANRVHIQRSAVAKIVEAGGEVEYAYYFEPIHNDGWVQHSEARTAVPRWIRGALGDDYFSSVIGCKISYDSGRPIDVDHVLRYVACLTRLRFLDLQNQDVTDAGMAHIGRLRLLEKLDLNGTKVSDDGMRHLARLNNLVELWVGALPMTDAALFNAQIDDKKQLRVLALFNTEISDKGLDELIGLTNLWLLSVEMTNVTEEGKRRFMEAHPDLQLPL